MANDGDLLAARVRELSQHKERNWARQNFMTVVHDLIALTGATTVLEIGGGRSPGLREDDVGRLGVHYTTSDILMSELSRAPAWAHKFVFDVTSADKSLIEAHRSRYDFAFSKWVMEHVSDYRRAYANIHSVLTDGGVYIAWHPVLFSPPFLFNRLVPEVLSGAVLRAFFPDRNDEGSPKFPAYYSGARISAGVRSNIRALGFRDVWQLPFYGHGYYERLPGVQQLHQGATAVLRSANVTPLASYAFTIVRK